MGMTLLNELRALASVQRLRGLDSNAVKNAFFANYLAGLLFVRLQDLKGLALINDRAHMKLSSFAQNMSDITFWGRALFYPSDPLVKKTLKVGHADLLNVEASRILDSRVHKLIATVMKAPDSIDWQETIITLVILKHRFELNSSYFNKIVLAFNRWDDLSVGNKRVLIAAVYSYLNQADPKSALLSRVRDLSGSSMAGGARGLLTKLISYAPLKEDEGGGDAGTSTANIATGDSFTGNAIISRFGPDNNIAGLLHIKDFAPMQVGDKKTKVKPGHSKRARNFKLIKFKMPTKTKEKS